MKRESKQTLICIFQLDAGNIEIREAEDTGLDGYLSWKIAMSVATLVALWWKYRDRDSEREKRFATLVIQMPSSGHIDVKELDNLGDPKAVGCSLPISLIEAMGDRHHGRSGDTWGFQSKAE